VRAENWAGAQSGGEEEAEAEEEVEELVGRSGELVLPDLLSLPDLLNLLDLET
jgi:hypothetical protein